MLRELSSIVVYSGKTTGLSLVTRVTVPLLLSFSIILTSFFPLSLKELIFLSSNLLIEFVIIHYIGGIRRVLSSLKLVFTFIILGATLSIISRWLGITFPSHLAVLVGALRITALVISLSLIPQWLSLRELRWILTKIGLRNQAIALSIALTQLPLTFIVFSEAITTVRLKYGGKNLTSLVKPMLYHTLLNSRNIAEGLYLYGIPEKNRMDYKLRRKDTLTLLLVIVYTIGILYIYFNIECLKLSNY